MSGIVPKGAVFETLVSVIVVGLTICLTFLCSNQMYLLEKKQCIGGTKKCWEIAIINYTALQKIRIEYARN